MSWKNDIFAGILAGPAGCTSTSCHGGGAGGLQLSASDSHAAYTTLLAYDLPATPSKPYVAPCNPAGSGFPCNMAPSGDAGANPYGACGIVMPVGAFAGLSTNQIDQIAEWIACGAPEN